MAPHNELLERIELLEARKTSAASRELWNAFAGIKSAQVSAASKGVPTSPRLKRYLATARSAISGQSPTASDYKDAHTAIIGASNMAMKQAKINRTNVQKRDAWYGLHNALSVAGHLLLKAQRSA